MKKIISFILCLMLIMSAFSAVAAQDGVLKNEHKALLSAIGYYNEADDLTVTLTRGQYADLLVRSIYEEPEKLIDTSTYFNDVPIDHPYYASITLLRALEVALGDGNGNFKPDEEIIVNEAMILTVRFLGYKEAAEKRGYTILAAEKGLYKDFEAINENKLTKIQAFVLICNALNADISDLQYSQNAISRFISTNRKLFKIEGIVTDDGTISKYGQSEININQVIIDNILFENKTNITGLFGSNVTGYYIKEDNGLALISVIIEDKGDTLSIDSKNIISFDPQTSTYKYYSDVEQNDEEEIEFSKNITIIYNGVPVTSGDYEFTAAHYVPAEGNVMLYDNDDDSNYDFLYINSYVTMVVSTADTKEQVIYSKYVDQSLMPTKLDLLKKNYEITDNENRKVTLENIVENDILTVAQSLDKKNVRIYLSKTKNADVCAGKDNGNFEVIGKNGTVYELAASFVQDAAYKEKLPATATMEEKYSKALNSISLSAPYTFYLDIFGRIAYASKTSNFQVAYLVDAGEIGRSSLKNEIQIRVYSADYGVKALKFADKVTLYDELGNEGIKDKKEEILKKINEFSDKNKNNRLIRYKANEKEEVTEIELPLMYGVDNESRDRLSLLHAPGTTDYLNGYIRTGAFNKEFFINTTTKIIAKPPKETADEKDYFTLSTSDFSDQSSYNFIAYTTDRLSYRADYLIWVDSDLSSAMSINTVALVTGITERYDRAKDERSYLITIATSSANKGLYTDEFIVKEENIDKIINNIPDLEGNKQQLSPGDMILYRLFAPDKDVNYLSKATLIFDSDKTSPTGEMGTVPGITGEKRIDKNPMAITLNADKRDSDGVSIVTGYATAENPSVAYGTHTIAMGYLYDAQDGLYIFTTQPVNKQPFKASLDSEYRTEVRKYSKSDGFYHVKSTSNGVAVTLANEANVKPYTKYGADCTRVIWTNNGYNGWHAIFLD